MRSCASLAGGTSHRRRPDIIAIDLWSVHGRFRHGRPAPRRRPSRNA